MSIKFTNARQFYGNPNLVTWDNRPTASLSFFYRYEPDGGTSAAVLNGNYFIVRGLGSYYAFTTATGAAGTMSVRFVVRNVAGAQASWVQTINVGTVYHIAITYQQGAQTCWVNGTPHAMGTLTGNTQSTNNPVGFGVSTVPGTPFIFTLDDFAMWNGYVLTPTEIAGLRDGTLLPPAIGAGASFRARWTMAGTPAATVTLGDAGLANAYGDTFYDLNHVVGSGSAVYSAPLVFTPAVVATPYVATSGKAIGSTFVAASNGSVVTPTAATIAPTVTVNGVDLGPLIKPWLTGHHPCMLYALPDGTSVGPDDVVKLAAPAGWADSGIGIVAELDGAVAIANHAGGSAFGTEDLEKTLRPGWNNAHLGSSFWSTWTAPKNWITRCDVFDSILVADADGKPMQSFSGHTFTSANFYNTGPATSIDQTIVIPVGYWAVCWDDTLPTPAPTTMSITSSSPLLLTLTEMTDGYNPGSGGVGICRVYRVDALSTIPVGSSSLANLRLTITNSTGIYHFDNAVVYGPGDFTYTPGTPTVVDRSDMHAISNAYLARMANGVGSLRWVDSLWGFGGTTQESEPEQVYNIDDFNWGAFGGGKVSANAHFTSARPWNPAVTPYVYTTLFGSPYDVTLASPIADTTTTTVAITPDAANPVIIGLRLVAGSELMRVMDVSGSSVTVERGSCGTTPATHAAGTIQVQNRWLATGTNIPNGQVFELVGATPHGINTGQALIGYGNWPLMTFTDGLHPIPSVTSGRTVYCTTGPNTVLGVIGAGSEVPWVTLNQTHALDSTCYISAQWPDAPAIPVEFAAKVAAHFDDCNLHINIPHAASDSLIYQIAAWVRDNLPAGRRVYVEFSNEPWNFFFNNFAMLSTFAKWLYPVGTKGYEFYVLRATQVKTIFRSVFGPRADEIFLMVNTLKFDASGLAAQLEFAKSLGVPFDIAAIAPYIGIDAGAATQVAYWQYDDEQAIDLYIHDLRYNSTAYPASFAAMNAAISAYNTKYGEHVQLYGYEGGIQCAAPPYATSLTVAVDASQVTIPVALAYGFPAGTPLLVGTEWMTVVSVAGKLYTVARGAFGSTAASHASGSSLRTAYLERSGDLTYNPSWYFAEQDWFAMLQLNNFCQINQYTLCIGSADGIGYGSYKTPWQVAGRGDGSGGGADNRLTLACPGKAHSKSATTNQDVANDSVRGRAFIDWMGDVTGVPPVPPDHNRTIFPFYRNRATR